MAKDGCQLE